MKTQKFTHIKIVLIFIILTLPKITLASISNSEYRSFTRNIIENIELFRKKFHDGSEYSLYVSEYKLKPFANNLKEIILNFYQKHNDLDNEVKNKINEIISQIDNFEKLCSEYSLKIANMTKGIKDMGESIGNED